MQLNPVKVQKILSELESIAPNGDLTTKEIAKRIEVNWSTAYRYLGILCERELIKISRTIDKANLYKITEKGIEYLKKEDIK